MKKILQRFPVFTSFLSVLFGIWGAYLLVSETVRNTTAMILAIFVVVFLIGMVYGVELGREKIMRVCLGISLALLLPWAPIVVITYGVALLAAPFLICLVGIGAVGVFIGDRIEKRFLSND